MLGTHIPPRTPMALPAHPRVRGMSCSLVSLGNRAEPKIPQGSAG